jgi:putative flippase GtrA
VTADGANDPALRRRQLLRFLLIGGGAAAANWLVRFPLSAVMPFEWAVAMSYVIVMGFSFVLYGRYVFPGANRPLLQQAVTFLLVNIVGAAIVTVASLALLWLSSPIALPLTLREGVAHGLAIVLGAVSNFFGHRLLTYRQH